MADHEDQNEAVLDNELPELDTLPEGNELPDIGLDNLNENEGGLPDLGDDLPDLAGEMSLGEEPVIDASAVEATAPDAPLEADLSDLRSPVNPTSFPSANSPGSNTVSGDGVMAFKKIQGIKVRVQVMLGETRLTVSQLANLKKGEFIQLDTKVGEPVDILANGSLIARGEIAVEDEETPRFGITLTEIVDSSVLSN